MAAKSTPESFLSRINTCTEDACWPWTGARNNSGYGTVRYQGRVQTAHRLAAFLAGLVCSVEAPKNRRGSGFILHQCDNPLCCNPAHMRVGTYAENQREAYARKRRAQPKGTPHANSKITVADVRLIRRLYADGVSQEAIGRLINMSQSAISSLLLGKTYATTI